MMSINKHSTSKQPLVYQWRPWCQWPTAQWRCRVETESPVVICRIETENTVEIESPDMFKETWADQLGVQASLNQQQESNNHLFKDARTIADAVGASITKPAAGAAPTTKEPTTTSTARICNRRAGLFGGRATIIDSSNTGLRHAI